MSNLLLRGRFSLSLTGAAGAIVVLALLAAAAQAPGVVRLAYDSATAPGQTPTQRELAPFDPELAAELVAAAKTLPRTATYTIVFGQAPPVTPGEQSGANSTFQYWLLPRHFTATLAQAQWVIAYHHASETIGVHYRKEIPLGPYVNTFKVTP